MKKFLKIYFLCLVFKLDMHVVSMARDYAIEASPFTFELLKANIHSNHLNNIRPFNVALSDRPGKYLLMTVK